MTRLRLCALLAAAVLALVTARGAAAGPPTDQLKGAVDRVVKVVEDPSLKSADADDGAARRRAEDRRRDLRLQRDRTPGPRPPLAAPDRQAARGVRRPLQRPPRALVHLQDRAVRRREDPVRRRARGRGDGHGAHPHRHEERHRGPHRLPPPQEGRPLAGLRRQHRGREPRLELPHPVQQDHPDRAPSPISSRSSRPSRSSSAARTSRARAARPRR